MKEESRLFLLHPPLFTRRDGLIIVIEWRRAKTIGFIAGLLSFRASPRGGGIREGCGTTGKL